MTGELAQACAGEAHICLLKPSLAHELAEVVSYCCMSSGDFRHFVGSTTELWYGPLHVLGCIGSKEHFAESFALLCSNVAGGGKKLATTCQNGFLPVV